MEKSIIYTIILVVLAGFLFWGFQTGTFEKIFKGPDLKPVVIPEGIILFYGEGCPHCKNVDDFVLANKIEEKVKFIKLEVWYNKDNQGIITQVAKRCGITSSSVGVPFLYDGVGKCYVGDVDAINFFKTQVGIN